MGEKINGPKSEKPRSDRASALKRDIKNLGLK